MWPSFFAGLLLLSFATFARAAETAPFQGQPDLALSLVEKATGLNIADFNGDERTDVVVLSGATSSFSVLLAQSGPKFAVAQQNAVPAGKSASDLALGDMNEDGKVDIAVCHHDSNEIWLFLGKGDGAFQSPVKIAVPVTKPHCHGIVATDMNHDHHLDLVLAESSDNCVWILLGDGKGKFARSPGSPISTDQHPYEVAVADFNRDKNPDVATPNWFGKSVGILLGDGKGQFISAPASPFKGPQDPTALATGDLTGDGNPDLVVGNNGSRGLQIFIGDGTGRFRPGPELKPAEPCYGPSLADLDGDGKLDVVSTATGDAQTLSYWLNRGGGAFSAAHALPCAKGANTLRIADIDHDGRPDLLVGSWERGPVLVWLGRK